MEWLPRQRARILDLSKGQPELLSVMLAAGHEVIHVDAAARRPDIGNTADRPGDDGHLRLVRADKQILGWLADRSVDAVVAEGGALSEALAAECTLDEIARVLRLRGRLLLSVESLVGGLAQLADQSRWAELADVPAADVVLVPGPNESIRRCFWPEELAGMLRAAGFELDWIRPRTVLAEQTVTSALLTDPRRLATLANTELALAVRRQGESVGGWLVASARKA